MDKQREMFEDWFESTYITHNLGYSKLDMFAAWQAALKAQWQPIETAPAGESILIYQSKFKRVSLAINDGFEWKHATHWMPLPQEPTE